MESAVLTFPSLSVPARLPARPRACGEGWLLPRGPVSLLHPFGSTRFYRHGWHSWSPTDWVSVSAPPERPSVPPEHWYMGDDAGYLLQPRHGGSGVGGIEGPDGLVLLLGALESGARVEADDEVLRGSFEEGQPDAMDPQESWFVTYGEPVSALRQYAEALARRVGTGKPVPALRVWCSWYGFYRDISPKF